MALSTLNSFMNHSEIKLIMKTIDKEGKEKISIFEFQNASITRSNQYWPDSIESIEVSGEGIWISNVQANKDSNEPVPQKQEIKQHKDLFRFENIDLE
jgi:hypothetical protein